MSHSKTTRTSGGRGSLWASVAGMVFLIATAAPAGNGGPAAGFNAATPYLIYYGSWNATQVDFARLNYKLVILDAHHVTAAQVAAIQRGPDNIAGTSDDVKVLGYVSLGEDTRTGGPFIGDRLGPRVDPRSSDTVPLASLTNALGLPSPGGTNYASYYLDTKSSPDGVPDTNPIFGGYYINAGAPAWWPILKGMVIANDGNAGLDELLTTNAGKSLNCDGIFMDTIDTCAPNSFGATTYEWTAPGMRDLVQRISTNYPAKILLANRGLFFYNPNYKQYAYTLRPYVNLVFFESYFNDSGTGQISASFLDNKYDWAPKLNAEAGRPDGFNVLSLDYNQTPALPQAIVNQSYQESLAIQGWMHYRTDPTLTSSFNLGDPAWLATNADASAPVWSSTAAQSSNAPAPRVGVQAVVGGNQSVTVLWDVANDQTQPVRYNVYYAAVTNFTVTSGLNFATATKLAHVAPALPAAYAAGTGPGIYPYACTVTGLTNGVQYLFAVRAEDSATPVHEDTNTATLLAVPGTNSAASNFRNLNLDGDFSDWAGLPWAYQGAPDGNPVNFVKIQFANDASYLYGHFILASNAAPFSDYNAHLFVDRDSNLATGYQATSAAFGSEWMIESGFGYDERNGNFNAGAIANLGWNIAPLSGTEFEFRVSLAATFPDGSPVFTNRPFRLLLQDNLGGEAQTGTGISYLLAPAPPSSYRHITVDGNLSDWSDVPIVAIGPTNGAGVVFANASVANDNDYLYLRFALGTNAAPFSDFNTHLFVDTDTNASTGYHAAAFSIGSEFMVESGTGYDERNGTFANGSVTGLDWQLSPAGNGTNFEVRLSRLARYADNSLVFTNATVRIVFQDNRGSVMTAPGILYTFAPGGPYEDWRAAYFTPAQLANPAVSGDGVSATADGIPNLVKYAFNLNPLAVNHPVLPAAVLENGAGTNFLDLQYVQRNPPAGVSYTPQVSTNLVSWSSDPAFFSQAGLVASSNDTSVVTLRLQGPVNAAPARFVRLAIQKQ
ncbi:MAG: hypothetical protein P4N60_19610 [Verrucomicrobiae bacterium]|nr:hypothetical protein [Verrucomicrobiae bacterium]